MNTLSKLSCLLLPMLLCQCAPGLIWQRDKLGDYTMRPDRDLAASSLSEHVFFSREAASGGRGVGGGGCGCN
ncbi:MAG: DUF4266 domain-containing protein [Verrucomicrobiaceae bacterium]|nr:DUF4266 domain-containing protein [Verrucomicrobiaceae bacterium]